MTDQQLQCLSGHHEPLTIEDQEDFGRGWSLVMLQYGGYFEVCRHCHALYFRGTPSEPKRAE